MVDAKVLTNRQLCLGLAPCRDFLHASAFCLQMMTLTDGHKMDVIYLIKLTNFQ